ncbi:MAG: 2-amino-4-hydroxy-6-hydroxymethyldihydropteridine diphosphokinase [Syntrophobacteria bacterium]
MQEHKAYIGFGSNLGDRLATCKRALEELAALPACRLVKCSSFYETGPVGILEQPLFINGVALLQTRREPKWLLRRMLAIEKALGRVATCKWGPRCIDLDLLFFDDLVMRSPELSIPHPLLHERCFVLEPLNEIASRFRHPCLGKTVAELRDGLKDANQQVEVLVV